MSLALLLRPKPGGPDGKVPEEDGGGDVVEEPGVAGVVRRGRGGQAAPGLKGEG